MSESTSERLQKMLFARLQRAIRAQIERHRKAIFTTQQSGEGHISALTAEIEEEFGVRHIGTPRPSQRADSWQLRFAFDGALGELLKKYDVSRELPFEYKRAVDPQADYDDEEMWINRVDDVDQLFTGQRWIARMIARMSKEEHESFSRELEQLYLIDVLSSRA